MFHQTVWKNPVLLKMIFEKWVTDVKVEPMQLFDCEIKDNFQYFKQILKFWVLCGAVDYFCIAWLD